MRRAGGAAAVGLGQAPFESRLCLVSGAVVEAAELDRKMWLNLRDI